MKKIILIINLLLIGFSHAQSGLTAAENYVYEKNCLTEDCSKKIENVKYFDGLGRIKQNISIKATSAGRDVAEPLVYDIYGRAVKAYLPIPQAGTQNGGMYTDPLSNASAVYGNEKIYTEKILEASPLGRILQQKQIGNDWAAHPVNFSYASNTDGEVKQYSVSTSWTEGRTNSLLVLSGSCPANTLYKSTVTDEDGSTAVEFKNKKGQTILVRKNDGTQNADTYYIYDKYGHLAYVIPPLASKSGLVDQTTLDNLCYQYRHDESNRLVEKKIPGKGWEYMVYDKADRLVMSQDANMKPSGKWMFVKYDKFSRVLYTGTAAVGAQFIRRQVQDAVDYYPSVGIPIYEERSTSGFTNSGMQVYYSNNAYPMGSLYDKILSVNYYDTYPQGTPAVPAQVLGQDILPQDTQGSNVSTKSLPTASYVKNIEDDSWTKNYIWYDTKGRAVGAHSINHLGGYTKTESELDFAGAVKQTKAYHKRLNTDTEKVITQTYEYDSQNRLLVHKHQVDSQPQELLAVNTYNELSQLVNKKVGNNLQSIDYVYNIKGWMTKVNDPAALNGKLFGYEIKYQNPVNTPSAPSRYNGNIAQIDWRTSQDGVLKRYSYQYDALSRLQKGIYSEPDNSVPGNDFFNEGMSYDLNGNILSLQRNNKGASGTAEQIDNLSYNYTGNRLNSVKENQPNYLGYPDMSENPISYDDNGNMKDQKDKGILQIDYNYLNLPDYIKFDDTYIPRSQSPDNNVNTRYTYRADGVKLKKLYTFGVGRNRIETNRITEYLDGFQYETTGASDRILVQVLKFVPTAEGYYNFENNKYIYTYTDHLGNVRLSYFNNGSGAAVIEENNYYPFGLKHNAYNGLGGNKAYKYQYNSKELQEESGMYDYGARMYMPDLGRWGVVDPLAENMRRFSPYNYGNNNPVFNIDPDGRLSQAFMSQINSSPSGTTWTNTGDGFTNNWGGSMGYSGLAFNFRSHTSTSLGSMFGEGGGGGSGGPGGDESSLSPWMQSNMGPNPMEIGKMAHSAMATFFRSNTDLRENWFPEENQLMWKWNIRLRPDLHYMKKGINSVWELKPTSNFVDSSLSLRGKHQAQVYADALTMLKHEKFFVGSSYGAPIPPINGRVATDPRSGYQFSYDVPIGTDGMIYYNCLNCQDRQRSPVRQTQTNPQTANQMGTGLAVALLILNIAVRLIPN
ncbi:DUF6443 domain-containing protein [Chryseobacterium polytrichastri]|nr:DUF6443 domain-containing protein [Chryseobacterium polytrichastri]